MRNILRFNNKNWPLPAPPAPVGYTGLKFTSTGNSTISMTNNGGNTPDMKYSLDGGQNWTQWDYSSISLADGETICFKGNNTTGFSSSSSKYSLFSMTGSLAGSGNIMSLIDDGACNTLTIPSDYCFYSLFQNASSLTTAPELPATTLDKHCYYYMFRRTGLTAAPALPATTLASQCYYRMFYECTNLATAPTILPATTLVSNCYKQMFQGCTSLTKTPELSATTLANSCYAEMFAGCTSLNNVVSYAQNISASQCLNSWLYNVSATGNFYNLGGANYPSGISGIPSGWTVHTSL